MSGLEAGSGWVNPNQSKCEVKWFWIDGLRGESLRTVETCSLAIVLESGLRGLRSQAEKLFRSCLIVVGQDRSNVTLRGDLVLRLCVDLVLG